jgi:hypothetical protein
MKTNEIIIYEEAIKKNTTLIERMFIINTQLYDIMNDI